MEPNIHHNHPNTIPPVSKPIAIKSSHSNYGTIALLIILPIGGFWLGMHTQSACESTLPPNITTETSTTTEPANMTNLEETNLEPKPTTTATTPPPATTKTTTVHTPTTPPPTTSYTPPPPAATTPTVVTTYITEATTDTVTLDYIAIYEGDAAVKKMLSDGLCPDADPKKCNLEEGYYYRNVDRSTKTFVLAADATISSWTGTTIPLATLKKHAGLEMPYTVTVNAAGVVTDIQEIYKP